MIYCKKCAYPINHPLKIVIDNNGVCSGCLIHEEKDRLNWNDRKKKLLKLGPRPPGARAIFI